MANTTVFDYSTIFDNATVIDNTTEVLQGNYTEENDNGTIGNHTIYKRYVQYIIHFVFNHNNHTN